MLRRFAYLLLLLGGGLFVYGLLTGEVRFALLLIFPVFYGSGVISGLAFTLIFLGFVLLFLEPFLSHKTSFDTKSPPITYSSEKNIPQIYREKEVKTEKKYGGLILIGPIPIVFGSDRDTVLVVVLIALLILAFIVFFFALPFIQG